MASLKDAQALTQRVRKRADELHRALRDDDIDFARVVALADELGDAADRVASTFQTVDDALAERLGGESNGPERTSGRGAQQNSDDADGSTGEESRPGDSITRQELLQRARKSGIRGRSEMSKDELIDALQAAGEQVE